MYLLSVRNIPAEYRFVGCIPTELTAPAAKLKTWFVQDCVLPMHGFPQILMYRLKIRSPLSATESDAGGYSKF